MCTWQNTFVFVFVFVCECTKQTNQNTKQKPWLTNINQQLSTTDTPMARQKIVAKSRDIVGIPHSCMRGVAKTIQVSQRVAGIPPHLLYLSPRFPRRRRRRLFSGQTPARKARPLLSAFVYAQVVFRLVAWLLFCGGAGLVCFLHQFIGSWWGMRC